MGLFSRISDIISANLNDMVEGLENPEKMLKQAVREMETTIEQAKQSTARTMADEKMIAKELQNNRQDATVWASRAETAVGDGNDELARKAIARKQEHQKLVAALEDQLAEAHEATKMLRRQLQGMQAKLAEAKRRLNTLTARKRVADVRAKATAISKNASPNLDAFAKFDRIREKVETAEAQAHAMQELTAQAAIDIAPSLESTSDAVNTEIEAELAELKKKTKSQNSSKNVNQAGKS